METYITKICCDDSVGVCLAYIHGTEKNPQPQRQTSVPRPQLVKIITKIALSLEIGYTMIPGETSHSDSDEETFFIHWRLLPKSRCSSKLTTIFFAFLWERQSTTRLTFCVSTSVRPIMLIKLFFLPDRGEVQDSTLRPCLRDCSVSQPEQELYNCLLWFVGCQILISKLVYLTCSCGSHSHIRSLHEEPSIWDSGSKSIFDERAWMGTSRHLSAVVYHQHWRIPPLSHVIYSQPLYILPNLLSSPSRWWKEPPLPL